MICRGTFGRAVSVSLQLAKRDLFLYLDCARIATAGTMDLLAVLHLMCPGSLALLVVLFMWMGVPFETWSFARRPPRRASRVQARPLRFSCVRRCVALRNRSAIRRCQRSEVLSKRCRRVRKLMKRAGGARGEVENRGFGLLEINLPANSLEAAP